MLYIGDHSNASSEVEYRQAYAEVVGEEGKGVKTIMEMIQSTRLVSCFFSVFFLFSMNDFY